MKNKLPRSISRQLSDDTLLPSSTFKSALKTRLFKENYMTLNKKTSFLHTLKTNKLIPIGIFVVALVFVGSTSAIVSNQQTEKANIQKTALPTNLASTLTTEQISAIALADVPTGTAISGVVLGQEDGTLVYTIKFSDSSFKLYDAKTGKLYIKTEDTKKSTEVLPTGFVATLTMSDARTIAQAQFSDKTIKNIELETENGVVVYSVKFTDNSRVDVNATDGTIVLSQAAGSTKTETETKDQKSDDTKKSSTTPSQGESHTEKSDSPVKSTDTKISN